MEGNYLKDNELVSMAPYEVSVVAGFAGEGEYEITKGNINSGEIIFINVEFLKEDEYDDITLSIIKSS
jgi:hypothetical protein